MTLQQGEVGGPEAGEKALAQLMIRTLRENTNRLIKSGPLVNTFQLLPCNPPPDLGGPAAPMLPAACLQADLGRGLPPSPIALWCSKEDLSLSTLNQKKNQREKSQTLKTGVKAPDTFWSAIPQLVSG